jgi:hypothetical protein
LNKATFWKWLCCTAFAVTYRGLGSNWVDKGPGWLGIRLESAEEAARTKDLLTVTVEDETIWIGGTSRTVVSGRVSL